MKIGIISYNKYTFYGNYGSILQSFALFKYLKNHGYDVEIVDYRPSILKKRKSWFPYSLKSLLRPRVFIDFLYNEVCHISRFIKLSRFLKRNTIISNNKYNSCNLDTLRYDLIIFGSDTIWDIRQTNGFDKGFFGEGINSIKVGFSISAADCLFEPSEAIQLKKIINDFKYVSFRDDSLIAKNIVSNAIITSDPTFLLEKSDYMSFLTRKKTKQRYILYFSLSDNSELNTYVKRIGKENHLKVICVSRFLTHAIMFHRKYRIGIEGFLSLIYNADIVVTNSFHGTVFSLIFNKRFYVYKRSGGNNKLEFLLDQFDLKDRLIDLTKPINPSDIDYDKVNEKMKELRERSSSFLRKALDVENDKNKQQKML